MFHFWVFIVQIGTQGAWAHNDGMMGDIGFKCPTGKWTKTKNITKIYMNKRRCYFFVIVNWFLCVVLKSQETYGFPYLEFTYHTHIPVSNMIQGGACNGKTLSIY